MVDHQSLMDILVECAREVTDNDDAQISKETRLLGADAMLDSLGLVTLIAAFEAEINDTYDVDVLLADERAMSMKRSPFRSIGSLLEYASTLIEEQRNEQ